jgi:glycosyltransferase involved in cell wall biosynthesis
VSATPAEALPRVHVIQPVVPHYRVPFFDRLGERFGDRLTVAASKTQPSGPNSAAVERPWLDLRHDCLSIFSGRLLWQRGLRPQNPDFGAGDVVVLPGNPRYLSSVKVAWHTRSCGAGLVIWSQLWSPTSKAYRARLRLALLRTADAVLTYTDDEAAQLRPQLPDNIAVIGAQNAIDEERLQQACAAWTPERLHEFRQAQGIMDAHVLLFCGRLRSTPPSNVRLLLQALAVLKQRDSRYLAVIIGDGDERSMLERLSLTLDVANNVRWLGAQYDELENTPWFMSALCSVYPGAVGLSMMHALGYGVPVVTHGDRLGHNPEFAALRPGWNGLVFRPHDAGDLAEQIERLRAEPQLRDSMCEHATQTIREEYSLQGMVERFTAAVRAAQQGSLSRRHPSMVARA